MTKQFLRTQLLLIMIVISTGYSNLLAQPPDQGKLGRALEVITRFLDLTNDQREDFLIILQESHQAINPIERQRRDLRRELDDLLDSGEYDLTEVGAVTQQIHNLGHKIRDLRKSLNESVIAILDEGQKAKYRSILRAAMLQPVVNAYQSTGLLPFVVRPPARLSQPNQ